MKSLNEIYYLIGAIIAILVIVILHRYLNRDNKSKDVLDEINWVDKLSEAVPEFALVYKRLVYNEAKVISAFIKSRDGHLEDGYLLDADWPYHIYIRTNGPYDIERVGIYCGISQGTWYMKIADMGYKKTFSYRILLSKPICERVMKSLTNPKFIEHSDCIRIFNYTNENKVIKLI